MRGVPRVLLADDEPAVLSSTALLLTDLGFEVVSVSDPSRIASVARAERPDVILQDLRMPGLVIEDLVRELRDDPELAKVPIVLFSASMDLDDVASQVGVDHLLEKPFRPQELVDVLRAVLA